MTDAAWLADLPARARAKLDPAVWAYYAAGAGEEITRNEATAAWRRYRILPRVLRGSSRVSTAARLLGDDYGTSVGIAPTSMQRAADTRGECAVAAAAAAVGAPHVVSSNAGFRFDEIAASTAGRPWWLQVYLPPRREDLLPLLRDAVAAGARALVLTVDTPAIGEKPAVQAADFSGVDLSWHRMNLPPGQRVHWAADLGPTDLDWLRTVTGLPVVAKGVLRADDARACVDAGAAAVWVSNHGGRQLDRAVATAQALPWVTREVGAEVEVYVDGGVRSGLDALVAFALAADAVFLGRPVLHALAAEGEPGVRRLLRVYNAQLHQALELAGAGAPEEARGVAYDVTGDTGSRFDGDLPDT